MPARIDASRGRGLLVSARQTAPSSVPSAGDLGLSAIANELDRRQDVRERKEIERRDQEEGLVLARELGAANREVATYLDKVGEAYDGSEPGFADQAREDIERLVFGRLDGVDPAVRGRLAPRLEGVRNTALMAAQDLEVNRRDAWLLRTTLETSQETSNAILSDPALYASAMEAAPDLAAGAGADQSAEVLAEISRSYTRSYAQARIAEDPRAALEELNGGTLDRYLAGNDKAGLIGAAETEIARAEREAERRAREERMYGLITMAPLAEDHVASIAATGEGVEGFDPDVYMRLLQPQQAAGFAAQLERANAVYEALGDLPSLTAGDLQSRLEALRPEGGEAGFAQDQEIFELAARAVARERELRLEDPALAAARSGAVSEAMEAYQRADEEADLSAGGNGGRIAARERLASAMLTEQARLGVPPTRRRVMTGQEAAAVVAQYEAAEDPGRALRDIMLGVSEWGEYSGMALQQLSEAGLPQGVRFASALAADPGVRTRYARALTQRRANEDLVPDRERRDIEDRIMRELAPLTDSFSAMPNGSAQALGLSEAAVSVALDARARGASPGDAARAAAALFTERYAYVDTYRIPAEIARSRVDVRVPVNPSSPSSANNASRSRSVRRSDVIDEGAQHALSALLSDDGARLLATEGGEAGSALAQARITAAGIDRGGQWVTAADEAGLELVVDRGGAFVPVRSSAGVPVRFSWDELESLGRARLRRESASAAYDRLMAARDGRDPDEPVFIPAGGRGRVTGEGARNWPIVRRYRGDNR